LADAWWAAAQKEADAASNRMRTRAAYWYLRALPQLTDLDRTKAEMRTDQATGQNAAPAIQDRGLTASELEHKRKNAQRRARQEALSTIPGE